MKYYCKLHCSTVLVRFFAETSIFRIQAQYKNFLRQNVFYDKYMFYIVKGSFHSFHEEYKTLPIFFYFKTRNP